MGANQFDPADPDAEAGSLISRAPLRDLQGSFKGSMGFRGVGSSSGRDQSEFGSASKS